MSARTPPTLTVHPRSRGEHHFSPAIAACASGSSPLARGTRDSGVPGGLVVRFIPARAGNTCPSTASTPPSTVHPRSRGEHHLTRVRRGRSPGSSPLARGTHATRRRPRVPRRFIPARAGNTATGARPRRPSPVHPRSRGEHHPGKPDCLVLDGSSPLARGTPASLRGLSGGGRFIPARAGNTWRRPWTTRRTSVHPRSRGEHERFPAVPNLGDGSSPLARGTH